MSDSKFLPENYVSDVVAGLPKSGIRDFFDIVQSMSDVISLGVGEPDFSSPWHVREHAIYTLEQGVTSYTSNLGLPKLRSAVSGYVARTFGVEYNPDNEILVTVGVSEALDLAVRAICNPGDEVIYHEPCYVSYRPLIQLAHAVPVVMETKAHNNFRVTADMLREKITDKTRMVILNFPNNPTGGALTQTEVEELAKLIVEKDLILISDEIYSELTYDRDHIPLVAQPGMRERTIFLHGFSKAFAMTGWRIGYACAVPELTEAMMKIHQYTMLCAPVMSQEAAYEALKQPEKDIQEMKSSYERRRNFLHAAFTDLGLECNKPDGAFYMFPDIRSTGLTSGEFALRFVEEESVAAVPGTAFGECGEGHLRCCYATSLEELKVATERLGNFLERVRKG